MRYFFCNNCGNEELFYGTTPYTEYGTVKFTYDEYGVKIICSVDRDDYQSDDTEPDFPDGIYCSECGKKIYEYDYEDYENAVAEYEEKNNPHKKWTDL